MSKQLNDHLYPKGRSAAEPDLMPNVLDSDGAIVTFDSTKRKTTESTVVNLGDSPNSNNGDPLRTAFAKINNFIEASYWTNEGVNQEFTVVYDTIDSEIQLVKEIIDSEIGIVTALLNTEIATLNAAIDSDVTRIDSELKRMDSILRGLDTEQDSDFTLIQDLTEIIGKSISTPASGFPATPSDGMLFFKTDTREFYVYDNVNSSGWILIGTIDTTLTGGFAFRTDGGNF